MIDNELVMEEDEDDENDGLVVDIMGNEEDKAVDLSDEDSDDDDIDSDSGSFFQDSSLFSIKRGTSNNNKRTHQNVESSPTFKFGPSNKKFKK